MEKKASGPALPWYVVMNEAGGSYFCMVVELWWGEGFECCAGPFGTYTEAMAWMDENCSGSGIAPRLCFGGPGNCPGCSDQ